ncbi:hypothetical protein GCM10028817_03080 [Spirosoma pomorum]
MYTKGLIQGIHEQVTRDNERAFIFQKYNPIVYSSFFLPADSKYRHFRGFVLYIVWTKPKTIAGWGLSYFCISCITND